MNKWILSWLRRLASQAGSIIGLALVIFYLSVALAAPWIAPTPNGQDPTSPLLVGRSNDFVLFSQGKLLSEKGELFLPSIAHEAESRMDLLELYEVFPGEKIFLIHAEGIKAGSSLHVFSLFTGRGTRNKGG